MIIQKKLKCLNCDTITYGKYCNNCGQKTDTKRLDFSHFIKHDIVHGLIHFDKGLLFTLKEIILRPSKVVNDYIKGKRITYYNFFYLTLIIIGLTLYIKSLDNNNVNLEIKSKSYIESRKFAETYIKYILFSFVPFFALASSITYRRVKYNFSEHCIIASINLIYFLIYNFISQLLDLTALRESYLNYFLVLATITSIMLYYQTFKNFYTTKKYLNLANSILTILIFAIIFILLISIIVFSIMLKE